MPIFLFEDEATKLGGRTLVLPQHLVDHLYARQKQYSGKQYKDLKGYKRLNGLLNKNYNDPAENKEKQHNNHTISFADAKRMDFDIRHMPQTTDNVEYSMIGGDMMRDWLHNSLGSLRNSVHKVDVVPEVPKLSTNDTKPEDVNKTIKINGLDVTMENKNFNKSIKQLFN